MRGHPMNEQPTETFLRRAVHEALDGATAPAVDFAAVAARARGHRRNVIAGATALALLIGAGSAFAMSRRQGHGTPVIETGAPGSAKAYCPPSVEGLIRWPAIDDTWLAQPKPTGGAIPAFPVPPGMWDGDTRIPFPANIVVVCRYSDAPGGRLVGSGLSRDPGTVASLEAAANNASGQVRNDPCTGAGQAFAIFGGPGGGTALFLDLTSCDVWLMPDSVRIPGSFVHDIETLAPVG